MGALYNIQFNLYSLFLNHLLNPSLFNAAFFTSSKFNDDVGIFFFLYDFKSHCIYIDFCIMVTVVGMNEIKCELVKEAAKKKKSY